MTANDEADTVSVFANRGDGSFRVRRSFPTAAAGSIALGDLNADGKPDVATTQGAPVAATPDGAAWILLNATGLCPVPSLRGKTLPAASRTLAPAHCRVGKIGRAFSNVVKRGRVISEKPREGAVLPKGGSVNLVVSRGRKR